MNSLSQAGAQSIGRREFAFSGAVRQYAPDRPFKLEHVLLNLEVNPIAKTLEGFTTQRLRAVAPAQHFIQLDQESLQIDKVLLGEKTVDFTLDAQKLFIYFGREIKPDEIVELTIFYKTTQPRRGIYFTGPDAHQPNKPFQVWTQGQDEDSRHWFPTLDYPNQKSTSEVIVRVPKGFTAISNGALISQKEIGDKIQFHYRLGMPHVTYLITLVVGEFSKWEDQNSRKIPVQYFVAPGREQDGERAFGNTPKMLEAFEKKVGVDYPYEKYSQVAVQDFIFGGMENTSATTQTDLTLHDERAHLDFSSDPLVSHELAHQWFGNLVTCRDWSHGWLNEGFATFMERVWIEEKGGESGGFEEAKYYAFQDLQDYLAEDTGKYRRPLVCHTYIEPIDLFDRHLYQKGGLVINLVRHLLGDTLFWKSIKLYVERHRGQNVETLDLIRAIEDATGKNLRRFFDEWVFHAGYPEFEVSYSWHEDQKVTEWVIEQKQTDGAPFKTQFGATTPLFHIPVVLEMTLSSGERIQQKVLLSQPRERVFIAAPSKPSMVRFDPDGWIPKVLKFSRTKDLLLHQLVHDKDCLGRIEAAHDLAKIADPFIVNVLGKSLETDPFWGVQAECAKALGEVGTEAACEKLIQCLKVQHPKARRAVVNALGQFKNIKASDALMELVRKDPSYFVEADSLYAWARARLSPLDLNQDQKIQEIEKVLLEQLKRPSYREVIRIAALSGLSELPGIESGGRPQALEAFIHWTQPTHPVDARGGAVKAIGRVLKKASLPIRSRLIEVLSHLAEEDQFRLRYHLIPALKDSGCYEAITILNRIHQTDADGRIRREARIASDALMGSGAHHESVERLKTAFEKLEEEHKKLRSYVEENLKMKST